MRKTSLKLAIISAFCSLAIIYGPSGKPVGAFAEGPPAARTGAPGELICADYHFGHAVNSGPGLLTLTGLPTNYVPSRWQPWCTDASSMSSICLFGRQLTTQKAWREGQ